MALLSSPTMSSSVLLLASALLPFVAADDSEYAQDPFLAFRPPFARSLPVQIMLTGVVLTLVAVLFIHLMFTAQYHWPLAPVNYVLQLSGVITLLISLIATIHVVLSTAFAESEKWPYMLSYMAVNVPPLDIDSSTEGWSVAERATWLVMNASTSGLIQITHIQFLTLLYPSRLEGRLIFALLGPLAVVAAIMQLLPISGNTFVYSIASAVRNVCNATLSLLFTLALFIWGLLVNRKSAWRTDGGTAVFGCAALSLAVVSTALNFLYVHKEEEFVWLPGLMWAVVLWQSFLGWWWWVGAGSGGAGGAFASEDENMEERLRRQAKRDARRREKRERKMRMKKEGEGRWKGVVAGAFGGSASGAVGGEDVDVDPEEGRSTSRDPGVISAIRRARTQARNQNQTLFTPSQSQSQSQSPSPSSTCTTTSTLGTPTHTPTHTITNSTARYAPRMVPGMMYKWYTSLRRAHNAAARVQAKERVERMREMGAVVVQQGGGGGAGAGGEGANGNSAGNREGGEKDPNAKPDPNVNTNGNTNGNTNQNPNTTTRRRRRETVEVEGWGFGWEGLGWRRRRTVYDDGDMDVPRRDVSVSVAQATGAGGGAGGEGGGGAYEMERRGRGRGRGGRRRSARRREREREFSSPSGSEEEVEQAQEEEEEDDDDDMYVSEGDEHRQPPNANLDSRARAMATRRGTAAAPAAPASARVPVPRETQAQVQVQGQAPGPVGVEPTRPRSVWWWGPLWRWRLQDSTVYK